MEDVPDPFCSAGRALVKVEACSVCGTDVKMLEHGHKGLRYPRILGHEIVGRIVGLAKDTEDLTRREAEEMFRQVLLNEQPDLQQGAFLAAITAKATPEETAGSWEAINEIDTLKVRRKWTARWWTTAGPAWTPSRLSTSRPPAPIVAAADGIYMAKHGEGDNVEVRHGGHHGGTGSGHGVRRFSGQEEDRERRHRPGFQGTRGMNELSTVGKT